MSKIELLAPAGDLARAKIAVMYGADAVYLGGKCFSLRSRASNFDLDDIAEAVRFARDYQAKIYVTVNIIPHDEDLPGLEAYLKALDACGVAAVIVSSVYIAQVSKQVAKQMEVHLSTQQSVTNSAAIAYYQRLGIDRIVLARELSLKEIELTSQNSPLPLEVFIHGGMCANYSGRCTMSNFMTFRDANRGGCAHSCRWFYHLYADSRQLDHDGQLFTMAATDLVALTAVKPLIKMGIVSLKIEGRMKSAYYIAAVVKTYRRLIDAYQLDDAGEIDLNWYQHELEKAENRNASSGYLAGIPVEDPQRQLIKTTASQEFVGSVVAIRPHQALIEVRNRFVSGDRLEVLSPHGENQSFTVTEIWDEEGQRLEICNRPMQHVWLTLPFVTAVNDMLRRDNDDGAI